MQTAQFQEPYLEYFGVRCLVTALLGGPWSNETSTKSGDKAPHSKKDLIHNDTFRRFLCMLRLVDRFAGFGRHIVLVVLG